MARHKATTEEKLALQLAGWRSASEDRGDGDDHFVWRRYEGDTVVARIYMATEHYDGDGVMRKRCWASAPRPQHDAQRIGEFDCVIEALHAAETYLRDHRERGAK